MSQRIARSCAALIALAFSTIAAGETTDPSGAPPAPVADPAASPGQVRVAGKFAGPFATLAGSRENAVALATALRTGSPATLTYTATGPDGTTITKTVEITPPTKPMGWGNVSHSLALAQLALSQQGISNPSGTQLQAALVGGTFTTADGKTVTMAGVLQQRADGMGFGQIARSYGTTMGAVNHGLKAPAPTPTPIVTTTPTKPGIPPATTNSAATRGVTTAGGTAATGQGGKGITTAGGTATGSGQGGKGVTTAGGTAAAPGQSGKGITTAAGTATAPGQSGKGITTASGSAGGSGQGGVVSADAGARGNGNAYGRGLVTASGSAAATGAAASSGASSGIVTGAGTAGGVVSADPGRGGGGGGGGGNGLAKGKGGG